MVWRPPLTFRFASLALSVDGTEAVAGRTIRATSASAFADLLIRRLAADWSVIPVPYDWRRSVREAVATFDASIPNEPFHIVAYSLGGLVARMWIAQNVDRWRDMQRGGAGGRLVMIATPNYGSWVAALLLRLIGNEAAARAQAALFFGKAGIASNDIILGAMRTWPGFYELLPSPTVDPRAEALYQATDPLLRPYLDSARAFHAQFDALPVDDETYYIAGWAQLTPSGPTLLHCTLDGDGVVPRALGVPRGLRHGWRAIGHHVLLPLDPLVGAAVTDILSSGSATLTPL